MESSRISKCKRQEQWPALKWWLQPTFQAPPCPHPPPLPPPGWADHSAGAVVEDFFLKSLKQVRTLPPPSLLLCSVIHPLIFLPWPPLPLSPDDPGMGGGLGLHNVPACQAVQSQAQIETAAGGFPSLPTCSWAVRQHQGDQAGKRDTLTAATVPGLAQLCANPLLTHDSRQISLESSYGHPTLMAVRDSDNCRQGREKYHWTQKGREG